MTEHWFERILPEVFRIAVRTSPPLRALVAVAEQLHQPVHAVLDDLDDIVDPYRAPEAMLPSLAHWVDLEWLALRGSTAEPGSSAAVPQDRLRELIAHAAELSAHRGTVAGLHRFLTLATGVDGYEIEDVPGAFHLTVGVPASAAGQLPLIQRIIATTKPVHVTSELRVLEPAEEEP
ncbi:phage tail protein [Kocuria rhizosphaericola]|uniref:phage tail protein n=1 Tax=Kocuria rhizosphaericola TaxID=3376284 RepID=UPI00379EB915